jgi:hypothetical protein
MEDLMLTYGNAEYFSKLLYQKLNKEYLRRIDSYYDQCVCLKVVKAFEYPTLNNWVAGRFYPDGAKFRELYEKAQTSPLTRSGIKEFDRNTREIQSVTCTLTMAQDHTMEMVKNYQKTLGAKACWTVCTETGEIASAVLVANTKCSQYAHAAESLARRDNFKPQVMYSDTWPHLQKFWAILFGTMVIGRLGLFHFMQRIIRTLRDSHMHFRKSIWDLRLSVYQYNSLDYDKVINALKLGTMDRNGYCYTDTEIYELQMNGKFKKRYDKWIRKKIYDSQTIKENLQQWFIKYKVTHSEGKTPGQGVRDERTNKCLFTSETKNSIDEALTTCNYISDVLPIHQMYTVLPVTSKSTHNLNEYVSHRVESRLEGFHDPLSNYANSGMTSMLADILHLSGTARYNMNVRQKRIVRKEEKEEGDKEEEESNVLPYHYMDVPPFLSHIDLEMVNINALKAGITDLPFKKLQALPPDNGERFFSQYFCEQKKRNYEVKPDPYNDRCQCMKCAKNQTKLLHQQVWPTNMNYVDLTDGTSQLNAISSPKKTNRRTKIECLSDSNSYVKMENVPTNVNPTCALPSASLQHQPSKPQYYESNVPYNWPQPYPLPNLNPLYYKSYVPYTWSEPYPLPLPSIPLTAGVHSHQHTLTKYDYCNSLSIAPQYPIVHGQNHLVIQREAKQEATPQFEQKLHRKPQTEICCSPFQQYLKKRRGRPPHCPIKCRRIFKYKFNAY